MGESDSRDQIFFCFVLQAVTAIQSNTMDNFLITNFLVSVILELDHFDTFLLPIACQARQIWFLKSSYL